MREAITFQRMQKRFRLKLRGVALKLREVARFRRRIKTVCHFCGDTTEGLLMFTGKGRGAAPVCSDCNDELLGKITMFEASRAGKKLPHHRLGSHVNWEESGSSFDDVTRAAED